MKKGLFKPLATALAAALQFAAIAAVPLVWDVVPTRATPAKFDRYHGETLDLKATFRGFGTLPFAPGADVRLYYQTNGMGAAWWNAPASVSSNVVTGTFSPNLDPGADSVTVFFGAPSNAYASAIIKLRPSPGFSPATLALPSSTGISSIVEADPVFSAWLSGNDGLHLPDVFMQGVMCFPYFDDYGVSISAVHPGALSFGSTHPDYSGISASLDLLRIPTDDQGFGTAEIAYLSEVQAVSNIVEDVRTESALVYRLYSGSNVVAEVTNYNSAVHAPELRLMQLNESNEYFTVWAETNGLARTLAAAKSHTDSATNELKNIYAPRAWSRTTSGLGADAPANTTWISTPRTVIAGGLEYAKIVDTYGEVWVLTSNGMAADFNPDTNAYFRITADDGTPVISIEKSDAQVVGAYAEGITVAANSVTMPVPVVSATAPTMWWSTALESDIWTEQSSPPTGATVSWSGTAGSWVCTVTFSGTRPPSMFFKFSFLQEGGVVIRNNATTDLSSGIWVNGTKFVPSVSGNNLIWTKQ